MKQVMIENLNIGDIFEMYIELSERVMRCVYTGKRPLPRVASELGLDDKEKLHCFVGEIGNYGHSLVAFGDEVVTKLDNVNDWIKVKFRPEEACDIYNHHKYFTFHNGVYRRHNNKKLMQKFIVQEFGVRQVSFDDIPESEHVKIIW